MSKIESSTEELLVEQDGRVLVVTFNRPDRLNTISPPMLSELSSVLTAANKDPEVRCIVLTGAGRGFCAGLDLGELFDRRPPIAFQVISHGFLLGFQP